MSMAKRKRAKEAILLFEMGDLGTGLDLAVVGEELKVGRQDQLKYRFESEFTHAQSLASFLLCRGSEKVDLILAQR